MDLIVESSRCSPPTHFMIPLSDKRGTYNTYTVINPELFLAAHSYTCLLHSISIWLLSHWPNELIVSKTECFSCSPAKPACLPMSPMGKQPPPCQLWSPNASVILTSFTATTFNESVKKIKTRRNGSKKKKNESVNCQVYRCSYFQLHPPSSTAVLSRHLSPPTPKGPLQMSRPLSQPCVVFSRQMPE